MNQKIMEGFAQMDEQYIQDAAGKRRGNGRKWFIGLLVCLLLAAGLLWFFVAGRKDNGKGKETSEESTMESVQESSQESQKESGGEETVKNPFGKKESAFDRSQYIIVMDPAAGNGGTAVGFPEQEERIYIEECLKKRVEASTDGRERFYISIRGVYHMQENEGYVEELREKFVYEGLSLEEWEGKRGTDEFAAMDAFYDIWYSETIRAKGAAIYARTTQELLSLMGKEYDVWMEERWNGDSVRIVGYLSKEQILFLEKEFKAPYYAMMEWGPVLGTQTTYDEAMRQVVNGTEEDPVAVYEVMIDVMPMMVKEMLRERNTYQGKSLPEWKSQEILTLYEEEYVRWCEMVEKPTETFEQYWSQMQPAAVQEEYTRVAAICREAEEAFGKVYDKLLAEQGERLRAEEKERLATEGTYDLWMDAETGTLMGKLTAEEMKQFEGKVNFAYRFCLEEREESMEFSDKWSVIVDA